MARKMPKDSETLRKVEVMRTPFRNFNGDPTKLNPDGGKRFFNVKLTPEKAEELEAKGWKVKQLPPRSDDEEPLYLLEVKVSYRGQKPPRIVKVTPVGKDPLTEDVVGLLDAADIDYADIVIRPYDWGGEFPSAYLQTAFIHIKMDELELEYALEDAEETDAVVCDDDGVCYINGVRIN